MPGERRWQGCLGLQKTMVLQRGFISFDISGLTGVTIQNATLTFSPFETGGDLSNFEPLYIAVVDYSTINFNWSNINLLFNLTGNSIQSFPASTNGKITCNSSNLKAFLQNAVSNGKSRFQIRIHFALPTDNDGSWYYWKYNPNGINLNVTYLPK